MNKRAQSKTLSGIFLSIIAVSIFSIGAIMYMQGGSNTYGVSYNNTEFEVFNQNTIVDITSNTQQTLVGANSTGVQGSSVIEVLANSGYRTLSIISNLPILFNVMFTALGQTLGIPGEIVILLVALVTVVIISLIVLLIMRVNV